MSSLNRGYVIECANSMSPGRSFLVGVPDLDRETYMHVADWPQGPQAKAVWFTLTADYGDAMVFSGTKATAVIAALKKISDSAFYKWNAIPVARLDDEGNPKSN